jgi:hypothetical protein
MNHGEMLRQMSKRRQDPGFRLRFIRATQLMFNESNSCASDPVARMEQSGIRVHSFLFAAITVKGEREKIARPLVRL